MCIISNVVLQCIPFTIHIYSVLIFIEFLQCIAFNKIYNVHYILCSSIVCHFCIEFFYSISLAISSIMCIICNAFLQCITCNRLLLCITCFFSGYHFCNEFLQCITYHEFLYLHLYSIFCNEYLVYHLQCILIVYHFYIELRQ